MELISCGNNTHLHTFPELKNEASYEHDKGAKIDFNIFHNNKFLIECVKNKGLIFLQAKKNNKGKSKVVLRM